jgi:hypothetical protein
MLDFRFNYGTQILYTNGDAEFRAQVTPKGGTVGDWSFVENGWTIAQMDIRPEACECRLDSDGDYLDPPVLSLSNIPVWSPASAGIVLDSEDTPGSIAIRIASGSLPAGIYLFDVVLTNQDTGKEWVFGKGFIRMKQGVSNVD